MKLITLNIWGGRVHDKLEDFFKKYADTDIFCFQEVFKLGSDGPVHAAILKDGNYEPDPDLFVTLKKYLPSHTGIFCQTFKDTYGIAIFLKSGIKIRHHGETLVARGDWDINNDMETKDHHRKIQWMELEVYGKDLLLVNAHLTHRPEAGKKDSEKRLRQSKAIVDLLAMFDGPKILAGDFNLLPNTQSVTMIEKVGMRNLVKQYSIPATRTPLYRHFANGPKFADYVFISPDSSVKEFKVLPDIVSDHAALFMDFEV